MVNGAPAPRATAAEMIHCGIQVIYQDLSLLPNLTVAENIAIAQLAKSRRPLVNWREVREIARAAVSRIKMNLDLDAIAGELPVGLQQMVAICRALTGDLRLLVLDQPTASLTKGEIDNLIAVVRDMQAHGIASLFISHKLNEVIDVADRVTVLRDGRTVGTLPREELSNQRLVGVIDRATAHTDTDPVYAGEPRKKLLEVRGLTKQHNFADISFDLYEGEILGVAGLIGSGRTELALALFGISPADSGSIIVTGVERRIASVQDAVAAGFAYVPENRMVQGLVPKHSVGENLVAAVIGQLTNPWGTIDEPRRATMVDHWITALSIRTSGPGAPVQTLSGGNQQRIVIGKWLATAPHLPDPGRPDRRHRHRRQEQHPPDHPRPCGARRWCNPDLRRGVGSGDQQQPPAGYARRSYPHGNPIGDHDGGGRAGAGGGASLMKRLLKQNHFLTSRR